MALNNLTKEKSGYSQSVYAPGPEVDKLKTHTLSILVENKPGALAKIIGFFTGRGYNIDSLSVAETDKNYSLSRLIIVTSGADMVLEQIKTQLRTLIQVRSVRDLTVRGPYVARELGLVKIALSEMTDQARDKVQVVVDAFDANVIEKDPEGVVYECVGNAAHVDAFIKAFRPFNPLDIARSGIAAVPSGAEPIDNYE